MFINTRQVAAILSIFKYKYLRDIAAPIKDYLFPTAIAVGSVFVCKPNSTRSILIHPIFSTFGRRT